jgi:hypothetical protein
METIYYCEFKPLKAFSLDITKKLSGRIIEALLHIEVHDVTFDLKLKNPKVPSVPSMTVEEFFSSINPSSVNSFKIFGKRYENTVLWHIEIWENSPIKTVHCSTIDGLPKNGLKKGIGYEL